MALNIADLLEHAVDAVPERTAVICGGENVSYAELDTRANRLANYLASAGIGKGDHIGVYSRNSIEMIETMFAAYKLRAIAVNVNYRYVHAELAYLFTNADLTVLVHEKQYSAKVAAVLPEAPKLKHVLAIDDGSSEERADTPDSVVTVGYEQALAQGSPERNFAERSPDDLYILYTGGTTGYPKGVLWRHEDVWRALGGGIDFITGEYVADEWTLAEQGKAGGLVRLPAAPLIHGAAQWAAFGALFAGGTVVFVPQFDADEVWRAIERHKVQVLTIVGDAMARPMLDAYREGGYDASSLVAVSSHAALFSHSVKQEYLAEFPGVVLTDAIGSSESGFTGIGMMGKDADHSAGPRVNFGKDAILLGDDDEIVPVEPGAIGRIGRRGHVPLGYYKDPGKSATIFVEAGGARYVVPGDYARYEADGTVTLLGRGSQCVNTGGEKVFPEEVEAALKSHPDVFDALVIAVADERLGQRVGAVIAPRAGRTLDLGAVEDHVRTRIAGYKVPRSTWIVPEVSRLPSGKPDYPWAQRHAAGNEPVAAQPTN
ncbi:acyl-CoA synthetase [Prauserella marina]|uniref:Acyl-CoA synthetase (AMP-forming)/AMP-acid ligase II n=1 Tax=Prauserella marina TaxID=530584 RepID=A0A222VNJ1_9PSEU|nr:acyl-CoA synthetase [Prauserella marina]ASR35444.1 acyl-CoA synthetase [Prauserella marina]PWV84744.1 acyl-CoA synthetase (AMP-forming)/AMP-acid ligase II [Prauserella marina]SDC14276.1 Acyl-CoA synthetase (AMP-forming)/AMP-acid ligase II [Prauserella marina]